MISEIEIHNFRSIISDRITLENITVLIGANGSGKSNLVKALEFLSDVPEYGLDLAITRQGGRDAIAPKSLRLHEIRKHPTIIRYQTCLPTPNDSKIESPESIAVDHEFELTFRSARKTELNRESLTFHHVLYVGEVLADDDRAPHIPTDSLAHFSRDSTFTISHSGGDATIRTDPPISDDNVGTYLYWLGLQNFEQKIETAAELGAFLQTLKKSRARRLTGRGTAPKNRRAGSFVDPMEPTIIDFAPNFQIFLQTVESIKRYDLLLNELRREHAPSASSELSSSGANLPAVLRSLSSDKAAFERLTRSFESIAPHIADIKSSSLRTGKEFVEFIESRTGRGIESWESSDGSLRALAILVALETTQYGETIIIEEPEQNLHPWAIRTLIDHMREVVSERNIQIILTTHSEHVLNRVKPSEVRVVSRDIKEGTHFLRLDQIAPEARIDMGEVGRLWVKGALGGVPSS